MLGPFQRLRPDERRDARAAFVVLCVLVGSHAVLETARDALFLVGLPASRLPVVYLMIAGVSLAITELQTRYGGGGNQRSSLCGWTAGAAAITLGFWFAMPHLGNAALYALYVWSGVLTTLILVHFWTLLSNVFSVSQAKRVYGVVGLGSVIGAIAGSAAAGALVPMLGATNLILLAAGGLAVAAIAPLLLRDPGRATQEEGAAGHGGLIASARLVARSPYASRVVALTLVATATLTVADYVFKSTAAAEVAPDELGQFFAFTYLSLNVASFAVQLLLVGVVVRRLGVIGTLSVLPVLLLLSGVGAAAFGGLVAALFVKGTDGAFKHTMHRTASELLFVAVPGGARARVKILADVVGQRGGQAVASLGILALMALEWPPRALAIGVVVLALAWIGGITNLRGHYVELFRRRLSAGQIAHLDKFPELDMASLESLFAALGSDRDGDVIAALDVLEREGRGRLIPPVIVYHPSEDVVRHALAQLTRLGRTNAVEAIDRILDHPSSSIRGAAIAARSVLSPDERILQERLLTEESSEVRAVIMVNLIASGAIVGSDAQDTLSSMLATATPEAHVALAEAIALRGAKAFDDTLITLAKSTHPEVRRSAAHAIATSKTVALLPMLVHLLADESTRRAARAAIEAFGDAGVTALVEALEDYDLSRNLRWRLPAAIAQCAPRSAGTILLERLARERDGLVRYGCVQALEALVRRHPELTFDRDLLQKAIESNLRHAYRYVDRRVSLKRGAVANQSRRTNGFELLDRLMRDKGAHALDRLFRLLALQYPHEDVRQIARGLDSDDMDARASSIELLESILRPPLRESIVGLVDDIPDEQRLRAGSHFHEPLNLDYGALLHDMLDSNSASVQTLTVHHIGELKLAQFRVPLVELSERAVERSDLTRTLALLEVAS